MPFLVTVLALGTFLMGTSEFVVVGLLPEIARDLSAGITGAGLLVTAFAVGMIGTPVVALASLKVPPRTTLVVALAVFATGHITVALSTDLPVILVARFLTALATGAFWSIGAAVAARVAGPGAAARAIGYVISGGILATVIGVPIGSFAGQVAGWRGPFWALAVLAVVTAAAIARCLPGSMPAGPITSVRKQIALLVTTKLWLVLLACVLINASVLSTYAFIAPLLTERAGIPDQLLPVSLVIFGLGALLGSFSSGRFGDRAPFATALTGGTAVLAALGALCLLSVFAIPATVLLALAGLFGMGTNPVLMALAVRYARHAPTLATSLATSFFNIGTALGSWVTARAIDGVGTIAIPVVGAVFAFLLLFPLTILLVLDRRNATGEKQRHDEAAVRAEAKAT